MSRSKRQALAHWVGIVAVLVAVAFALVGVQLQDQRIDALSQALGDEQSAIEARGEEPVAPDAEDLIEDPQYAGPAGPQGEPGPGPNDAQVSEAVADYLRDHPVTTEGPSEAEIVAAVANYLTEFPAGPSPEQVATAVADYLTANPPADGDDGATGPTGPAGAQGDPGRAPTAEQVAAAVQAYMDAHPLEECPEGYHYEAHALIAADGPPIELIGCYETTE
jgi:type II secretory pathway pseudopilin PulG